MGIWLSSMIYTVVFYHNDDRQFGFDVEMLSVYVCATVLSNSTSSKHVYIQHLSIINQSAIITVIQNKLKCSQCDLISASGKSTDETGTVQILQCTGLIMWQLKLKQQPCRGNVNFQTTAINNEDHANCLLGPLMCASCVLS